MTIRCGVSGFLLAAMLAVVALGNAKSLGAATAGQCQLLVKHGHAQEAHACYESLSQEHSPYLKAEGFWGLEQYQQANDQFRLAVAQDDKNAMYRVRWGILLHQRFNNTDAANLFHEALQRDPKNAQAYWGLALVSADGFDTKAIEYDTKAIELDPQFVEAHELMANLALEDSDALAAAKEADEAIHLSSDALDAMAIHAAIEILADRPPDAWLAKIQAINPSYGNGYAIVAHHLVLNRRYEDAVAYYRKAIDADPKLWPARSELGINLMRLGSDDESRKQLEMCYENGYRNDATVNSLRLLDSYKNFVTVRDDKTIIKLNQKEADLLLPYVRDQAERAISTYEKKYKMTLPGPVQIELYPNHEDFAVRTLGMPGLGALGVTFGEVIVMDSPSARKPGDFNWASTLWHEMSHVFILTATNHRVPRWFTEGLAVHEETQASPEWGDRVTPEILVAIRDKKLLPVADLDRGFVRPEYESQVLVSYYQAGRICDYIQQKWGNDKLLDLVHSFSQVKTTAEVIQENLGMTPSEFDTQFLAWLDGNDGKIAANFDQWKGNLKSLADMAKGDDYDGVIKLAPSVERLYPDYIYDANPYEFLAEAYVAKGDKKGAVETLAAYESTGGHSPGTLKELASLEEEAGDAKDAAAALDRINNIYPVNDEDLHRHLGDLWFKQNNYSGAIREYTAVLDLHPLDMASAEFDLAQTYFAAGDNDKAEQTVLQSLEAAPGYRPAQKLLLQLEDAKKEK